MNRKEFLLAGASALGFSLRSDPVPEVSLEGVSVDDFRKAVDVIDATTMFDAEKRADALALIQKYIYAMKTGTQFGYFQSAGAGLEESRVAKAHALSPVLWWYDHAAEKVLKELQETKVEGDRPAIWYVYNMGIVVKTKTKAFSIDLCHRLAAKFAPCLDFALITHNHGDHFTQEFLQSMFKCGAHVISNFVLDRYFYCNTDGKDFDFDNIRIRVTQGDHNKGLLKAINIYEVTIKGETPFSFVHSGDLHRSGQLRPENPKPDLFMAHCAVGLDLTAAYRTTMPAKLVLPMHHQELGHLGGRWRCIGFHEEPAKYVKEITALGGKAAMPVWGDRIV